MTRKDTFYPLLSLAILTTLLAGCSAGTKTEPQVQVPDTTSSSTAAVVDKKYTDGTFSATGNYRSPEGGESINVSLSLTNGVITDATFQGNATEDKSILFQGKFAAGFKEQVVGKSIDSLSLGVVNGSSLTPMGFMDAVAKIKAQAQA